MKNFHKTVSKTPANYVRLHCLCLWYILNANDLFFPFFPSSLTRAVVSDNDGESESHPGAAAVCWSDQDDPRLHVDHVTSPDLRNTLRLPHRGSATASGT